MHYTSLIPLKWIDYIMTKESIKEGDNERRKSIKIPLLACSVISCIKRVFVFDALLYNDCLKK